MALDPSNSSNFEQLALKGFTGKYVDVFCENNIISAVSQQWTRRCRLSVQYKGCGPETPTFVISATVISFYLPLAIMTVMYALTVRALQQQLKEQRRMTVTNSGRSRSTGPYNLHGGSN